MGRGDNISRFSFSLLTVEFILDFVKFIIYLTVALIFLGFVDK